MLEKIAGFSQVTLPDYSSDEDYDFSGQIPKFRMFFEAKDGDYYWDFETKVYKIKGVTHFHWPDVRPLFIFWQNWKKQIKEGDFKS